MAFFIQLKPELEQSLAAQARPRGLSIEQYIQILLEQQLASRSEPEITLEQFEAALDAVAVHIHKSTHLPLVALTSESIYKDHDLSQLLHLHI